MKIELRRCLYSLATWFISLKNGSRPFQEKCRMAGKIPGTGRVRLADERGFGMNELLGIAAALIVAGFVVIPSLRTLTKTIMDGLANWWNTTIAGEIFKTS